MTPRWLVKRTDLDAVARNRVMMVLAVLSGEKPVTTAVEEAGISRGFYYQLDQSAERDASGARTGRGLRSEPERDGTDTASSSSRTEARESGAGEAARRAALVHDAQARRVAIDQDASRTAPEGCGLDKSWAETFALLSDDETDESGAVHPDARGAFDPDAGWHERGPLTWERKLAGADAPSEHRADAEGSTADIHACARGAEGSGSAPALRASARSDSRRADDEQTMTGAAQSLGLSRMHFQTLFHRALQAMIDSITPKPAGRPAKPQREAQLEAENAKLKAELAALKERNATVSASWISSVGLHRIEKH